MKKIIRKVQRELNIAFRQSANIHSLEMGARYKIAMAFVKLTDEKRQQAWQENEEW